MTPITPIAISALGHDCLISRQYKIAIRPIMSGVNSFDDRVRIEGEAKEDGAQYQISSSAPPYPTQKAKHRESNCRRAGYRLLPEATECHMPRRKRADQ